MYGIIDRYIARNILVSVIAIAICLTVLTGLITLIDKLRYLGRGSTDFLSVCEYVSCLLPGFFVSFFPVSILIGGVVGLGIMARNSEIVVIQSLGLSRLNIAVSAIKSVIPLIVIVMLIGETVVPPLERYGEINIDQKLSNGDITVTNRGIWLKEGDSFIGIALMLNDDSLANIVRYDFNNGDLKAEKRASSGVYKDGIWQMQNVVTRLYDENGFKVSHATNESWKLNFNLEKVSVVSDLTDNLSILRLIDYIQYLEQNDLDSSRYRLNLYGKLTSPLVMIVMLLLALSTVFGPQRSLSMGTRILAGISLGFSYYVLNQIVVPFTLVYGMPPLLGASLATVLFGLLAIFLLRRKA